MIVSRRPWGDGEARERVRRREAATGLFLLPGG